jgi:large subunit ribosomal protein L28
MSRICDLTGKSRNNANNVSKANNKTKRLQQVNLHKKRIFDPQTGKTYTLKVSARALKTIDKLGSISEYLKKHPEALA